MAVNVLSFILLIPDNTRLLTALNFLAVLKMILIRRYILTDFSFTSGVISNHPILPFQSMMLGSLFHYSFVHLSSGLPEFLHLDMTISIHFCDAQDTGITNSHDDGLFRFHYVNSAVALMQKPFYNLTFKRITHRLVMLEFCHENAYSDRSRDYESNKFLIRISNQNVILFNILRNSSSNFKR